MTAPRGIRNNNPGNIRYVEGVTSTYQGCVGQDDAGFCRFDTPENGLRALCRLLLVYRDRHSLTTVNGILHRWAPPSDNNDTAAYVRAVCAEMGVARDAELPLHEPGMLALLATAITRHENGQQPYPADLILGAAHAALGMPAPAAIPAAGEAQPTTELPAPQPAPIEERGIPYNAPETRMGPLTFLGPILEILKLTGAFGSGEKAEKIGAGAKVIVDSFVNAVPGAVNEQDAIQKAQASPAVAAAAKAAVLSDPNVVALIEVGGGVGAARTANLQMMQGADKWWKLVLNPVLIVTVLTLPMVYLIVWGLLPFLSKVSADVIAQTIGTVIGLVLGSVMGFWMGQTYQNSNKRASDQAQK